MWINETADEDNILIQLFFEVGPDTTTLHLYLHEENTLLEQKSLFIEIGIRLGNPVEFRVKILLVRLRY